VPGVFRILKILFDNVFEGFLTRFYELYMHFEMDYASGQFKIIIIFFFFRECRAPPVVVGAAAQRGQNPA
jgi:hypothetical protein